MECAKPDATPVRTTVRTMNKLEGDYKARLFMQGLAGESVWFDYEPFKLRLADKTTYTPDFAVLTSKGKLEFHEVKGFMRDDAHVKLKVAAAMFPFRFYLAQRHKGIWSIKAIPGMVDQMAKEGGE